MDDHKRLLIFTFSRGWAKIAKVIFNRKNYFLAVRGKPTTMPKENKGRTGFSTDDTPRAYPYHPHRSPTGYSSPTMAAAVVYQQDRGGLSIAG
jgi:hypothetical protein